MLAPYWRWVALAVLLGFATIASSVGLMAASAWIITRAALQPSIAVLQVAIVSVRAFGIARGALRYAERLVSHQVTFRVLARLRVWFYSQLEPLAPARLLQHRGGDLLARIVADVETLQEFYGRVVAPPLVAALAGLLLGALLWGYSPLVAVAALGGFAAAGVGLPLLIYALSRGPGRVLVAARAELNATLVEGVQGLADLVAFEQGARREEEAAALSREMTDRQARMAWIDGLQAALGSLIASLTVIVALWAAIPRVAGIDLAVLALAVLASFEAVFPLPAAAQHLGSSVAAARRLIEVVDAPPAVGDPPQPLSDPQRFDLAVKGLCFRYAPGAPLALADVSFALPAGRCVGVVGPSGAGKSTLVSLLLRFWDYDEGRITLGGRDLRLYAQDDVRRLVAVVTQQTHLFNTTIRENLLLARPDADDAAITDAARQAGLHNFVAALPQGYDTPVGEMGMRLSGGERQRVAIARALLKDAPIMLLDEATANLDSLTERRVMTAIQNVVRGRTTLIVTHRLVGLEMADEVLVLRAGRIVERGTHRALLQAGGLYWHLWQHQRLRDAQ